MNISIGTRIKYQYKEDKDIYTIIGNRKLRSQYIYIVKDMKGKKISITRNSMLDALDRKVLIFM